MKSVLLALLFATVHLHGLATYYGPPAFQDGDLMRNGQPLDLSAPTMAVDKSLAHLVGRRAIVLTECGDLAEATITDTGMLAAADKVRFGVGPLDCARYWPVDRTDVRWADGAVTMPFVADFVENFFNDEIACSLDAYGRGETVVVWIWILPEGWM